jgi:hypothetical protein
MPAGRQRGGVVSANPFLLALFAQPPLMMLLRRIRSSLKPWARHWTAKCRFIAEKQLMPMPIGEPWRPSGRHLGNSDGKLVPDDTIRRPQRST